MEELESIEGIDPQKRPGNWERPLEDVCWQGKTPPIDLGMAMQLSTGAQRLALLGQQPYTSLGGSTAQGPSVQQSINGNVFDDLRRQGYPQSSIQWSLPPPEIGLMRARGWLLGGSLVLVVGAALLLLSLVE